MGWGPHELSATRPRRKSAPSLRDRAQSARCGKIDGRAEPSAAHVAPAAIRADARDGFAHPTIDLGLESLLPLAKEAGIAALAVVNSYNCGVCGYHVERIADAGLVALGLVNAPAAIALWGGPPRTGQMFIAIDPEAFAGAGFFSQVEQLAGAITSQEGARLPGDCRLTARARTAREGVTIRKALHDRLLGYCE